jgi:hypothetical protein
MPTDDWRPRCERPSGLVRPVRTDPDGVRGPTPGQARGPLWRRTSHGWYVPADVDGSIVEQRILEQSVRLPHGGALSGWAALRWRGAHYFEGIDRRTGETAAVPVVLGGWRDLGRDDHIEVSRERFWWHELEVVSGVPCAIPQRALFDELRRDRDRRGAVVQLEMTVAAGLLSYDSFTEFLPSRNGWTGVPFVRGVDAWAGGNTVSPPESFMRLVWKHDAGFPEPLCNKPLFDLDGRLLGIPDLFDPVAGVVGEYGGVHHTKDDRRRSDRAREDVLLEHGLSFFELVTGDLQNIPRAVRRMHRARADALFLPPDKRRWTLDLPPWWRRRHPESR